MLIVAYIYNTNGMASWCWEAAHALAEAGQDVRLICAPDVKLPGNSKVVIIRFAMPLSAQQSKVRHALGRLSSASSGFVGQLQKHLIEDLGIQPAAYFLNQSNFQDSRVGVPQHVVAWAYPTSLRGYLSKIGVFSERKGKLDSVRVCLDAIGWWRKDWRAYREATSVLAVTKRMREEVMAAGVRATVVYPGTAVSVAVRSARQSGQPCKLLITASNLEEPRKRVRFLLSALAKCAESDYCLTLVGQASDGLKAWAQQSALPANFVGQLSRDKVQEIMSEHDVFLFGSCLDDWGYVLVEAMSQGMCVVAPQLSPFDEIAGGAGIFYSPFSEDDLTDRLTDLLKQGWWSYQDAAHTKAKVFSRTSFSRGLLDAMTGERA